MEAITAEMLELTEDSQRNKFLIFSLGKEEYGIDIRYVIEIVGIQTITAVPELPDYIKGIINLRGKIIPVMDVRLRFGKEALPYNDRTCIVVIDIEKISLGLIIDSVSEVLALPETEITPPPQISKDFQHRYVKGIGKTGRNIKLLLDCEQLLNGDEAQTLNQNIS